MKLSVLIPVYNYKVISLLTALYKEIDILDEDVEVVCVDDHSSDINIKKYNRIFSNKNYSYEELNENLGRAKVRNYLAKKAKGDYILFLDSDVMPYSKFFLSSYLNLINNQFDVICGGLTYESIKPADQEFNFYIQLSEAREAVSVKKRKENIYKWVLTSNLLISRVFFLENIFSETFVGYGLEDTEWAIRIKKKAANILHIDNPVVHYGLMIRKIVFEKTKQSSKNFGKLIKIHPDEFKLISYLAKIKIIPYNFFDYMLEFFRYRNSNCSHWNYFIFQFSRLIWYVMECQKKQNFSIFF